MKSKFRDNIYSSQFSKIGEVPIDYITETNIKTTIKLKAPSYKKSPSHKKRHHTKKRHNIQNTIKKSDIT